MKRPDYRTLQALDAVIRERGFERAAQKLCITQSAVSQRIKQLENMFGQPLLVRTVPPRPTEQGQKLLDNVAASLAVYNQQGISPMLKALNEQSADSYYDLLENKLVPVAKQFDNDMQAFQAWS